MLPAARLGPLRRIVSTRTDPYAHRQIKVGGTGERRIVTIVKVGHRDGFYEE